MPIRTSLGKVENKGLVLSVVNQGHEMRLRIVAVGLREASVVVVKINRGVHRLV